MQYMGTISAEKWNIDGIKQVLRNLDVKEAYIGTETGKGGFKHYQFCVNCGGDLEEYASDNSLGWHIENCVSWEKSVDYCRKDGNYVYLGKSREEQYYFWAKGRGLRPIWLSALSKLASQNDREIDIWIDSNGHHGKSFTNYLLQRRGVAFCVDGDSRLMENIAMNYDNEPLMIVDIPRAEKIDADLISTLEKLKDGIISTGKYQGSKKYIRGCKILVFTNHFIPKELYKKLTPDRWRTYSVEAWEKERGITPR